MIGRRGFLNFLGLGTLAGVSDVPIAPQGIPQSPTFFPDSPMRITTMRNEPAGAEADYIMKEYEFLMSDKAQWIADRIASIKKENDTYYSQNNLDPDLQANKSFSLDTKRRLQIQRFAERRYENAKVELWELVKGKMGVK